MAAGTTVVAQVQVRNFTPNPLRLNLTIATEGLEFPPNVPKPEAIAVDGKNVATLRLKLDARKEELAGIKVHVSGSGHEDAETRTTRIVAPKPNPKPEAEEKPPEQRQ